MIVVGSRHGPKLVTKVLVVALCLATVGVARITHVAANTFPQGLVVSADPVNNTPHVMNGVVTAIATLGQKMYVAAPSRRSATPGTPPTSPATSSSRTIATPARSTRRSCPR